MRGSSWLSNRAIRFLLKVGDTAPNFTLTGTMGGKVTLADYIGKNPAVSWRSSRLHLPVAERRNLQHTRLVLQNSTVKILRYLGSVRTIVHRKKNSSTQLKLSFPLLSDFKDRSTAKAYGVLRPDGMDNRVTYVIGMDGKIAFVEVGNTAIDPTAADEACKRCRLAHRANTTAPK